MADSEGCCLMIPVDRIGWKELRKQKQVLADIVWDRKTGGQVADAVDGIISFLDYVQDGAAEILGEEPVFGKDCTENGGKE